MSLVDSNTYVEPTAGTSLNASRSQYNNSLRSILTNFKSTATPVGTNIVRAGASSGEEDGMLFRSATTNALYISDSVHVKSSPVGGNFTRVGIGNRVENGIVPLVANIASYEIGELVATPSAAGGLSANARLYLITDNSSAASSIKDIGIPPTNGSVTNTMLATNSITADRIKAANVTLDKVNFNAGGASGDGGVGATASLQISAAAGFDTSVGLGTINSANIALIHVDSGVGVESGLKVVNQSSNYIPVTSNLALQSAIQKEVKLLQSLLSLPALLLLGVGRVPLVVGSSVMGQLFQGLLMQRCLQWLELAMEQGTAPLHLIFLTYVIDYLLEKVLIMEL